MNKMLVLGILISLTSISYGNELIYATGGGDLDRVQTLIENGADVNAKDDAGFTALIWASQAAGHTEEVKLLIENGADLDVRDRSGFTALIWASVMEI